MKQTNFMFQNIIINPIIKARQSVKNSILLLKTVNTLLI